ncbi:hypothetical protein [Kitasatospora sp. NPDC001683]
MADVAHIIPPSPDDPPRRRSRVRPWHAAVALVAAAAVGGGLWAWKPWQEVELPQSACWSQVTKDELKVLAGPDGRGYEGARQDRMATPSAPVNGDRYGKCEVWWAGQHRTADVLLSATVSPAYDGIDADRQKDTREAGRTTPLDFGPDTVGWVADAGGDKSPRVRLYVRCDGYQLPAELRKGEADPAYVQVSVEGEPWVSTSPRARIRQTYADVALKIARAAPGAYRCANTPQLVSTAPTVPVA